MVGVRRENCRRDRSPVLGSMKVPLRSLLLLLGRRGGIELEEDEMELMTTLSGWLGLGWCGSNDDGRSVRGLFYLFG